MVTGRFPTRRCLQSREWRRENKLYFCYSYCLAQNALSTVGICAMNADTDSHITRKKKTRNNHLQNYVHLFLSCHQVADRDPDTQEKETPSLQM